MTDYRGADYRAETSSNPGASSQQKKAGGFRVLITIIRSHNKTKKASVEQKQRTVDGINNSESKTIHSNMESKIAPNNPQVRRERINETNETSERVTEVGKDRAVAKPEKIDKPGEKEEEDENDNKTENKSEKENQKEGKFRIQILKKKIRKKIQSIKENLAATKELKNQAGSKQNLTTSTSPALPRHSKKKNKRSDPPSVTDPISDSAEVERQKTEVTTEADYVEDYVETEEENNRTNDKVTDDTPDYMDAEQQSREPEYMAENIKRSNNEEYDYEDIQEPNDGMKRDEEYEYQSGALVQTTDNYKNPKQLEANVKKGKHGEFVGIAIGDQNGKKGYGLTGPQVPGSVCDTRF